MAQPELLRFDTLEQATQSSPGPAGAWDAVIAIVSPDASLPDAVAPAVARAEEVDRRFHDAGADLLVEPGLPGGRLVVARTGPLDRDHDDVRRFYDAGMAGTQRAFEAGARRPLLLLPPTTRFERAATCTVLGALETLWQPLEAREAMGETGAEPVAQLGLVGEVEPDRLSGLELGRRLARDLCGTEPERMAPPRFAEYCQAAFEGTDVEVNTLDDLDQLERDYPLLSAVARASRGVARHAPRVVWLSWGPKDASRTLFFAGKGVTYDTGGADIKAGGAMAGMSRDKGGAAAVAGLVRAAAALRPADVRIVAALGLVRNSVGSEGFVADEIIRSHGGARVKIGDTDAEGRLVLADLLSHLRAQAADAKGAAVFSVATLTGHAARSFGPYAVAVPNGPARERGLDAQLSSHGERFGEPVERSSLRREDFDFVAPKSRAEDVISCNNLPSTATPRGHQFPVAFLSIASGLDRHGCHSERPLPYVHIDMAGAAVRGSFVHGKPTGAPVVALAAALLAL